VCYHRPNSDIGNAWFVALGVLNTSGRIVSSATAGGVTGTKGNDGWFLFNGSGQLTNSQTVTFTFTDGSKNSFTIGACVNGGGTKIWSS